MYEKILTRNIIEKKIVSLVLEKKLFLNHTTLKFGGTHYGTEAKWKVQKIVLYGHQGGQYPQQYPFFFPFVGITTTNPIVGQHPQVKCNNKWLVGLSPTHQQYPFFTL
jgi:hypothetical protein